MAEPAEGSWGRLADLALPALALGTSLFSRSDSTNTPYSLALLFRMMEAQRERAQEQAGAASTARVLGEMGFKADPSMTSANQIALANARSTQINAERQAEKERQLAAEAALTRGAHGQIASLAAQVPTELPEVLRPQAAAIASAAARDPATQTAFDKLLTAIEGSQKRLTAARAETAGYETVTDYPAITAPRRPATAPLPVSSEVARQPREEPYSLFAPGEDMAPVSLPAMSLKTVPPRVGDFGEYVYQHGPTTLATAPGREAMFGLKPGKLIGSREAARTLAAPVHAPFFMKEENVAGDVMPFMGQITPEGKPTIERFEPLKGIAKPQRPERPQEHEIRQSLMLVAQGQPENPLVMKAHRGLSKETARVGLQMFRRAEQETSPQLSAGVLKVQMDKADTAIKRLDGIIGSETSSPRDKVEAGLQRRELVDRRNVLSSLFDVFATPGLLPEDLSAPEESIDLAPFKARGDLK